MTVNAFFPYLRPALPAFLGGFLFVLLQSGVEAEIAGAYGPVISLYAGLNVFLLLMALAGCCLAGAQLLLLGQRRGIYLCGVLLLLPLLLSRLPVPASPPGTSVFWDCFVKCLVFYGSTFAVLASVPVLVSGLENTPPAERKDAAPRPEAGASLLYFGVFFIGAGAAGALLISPAARFVGQGPWTGLYLVMAAALLACLARPRGPAPQPAAESGDPGALLTGGGMAACFIAASYGMALLGGPEAGAAAQCLLFFALAGNFIPPLRRRPAPVMFAGAALCVVPAVLYSGGVLPLLLFLLMFHLGRRVYWLNSEAPTPGRFYGMLLLGALGGALLGGAGVVWAAGRGAWFTGALVYSLLVPLMAVLVILLWRGRLVYKARTKYGKYKVVDRLMGYRVLLNGGVTHGSQALEGPGGPAPGAYYGPASPAGELLARRPFGRVAMLGLGTGAMCFYADKASWWTVYELDQEVADIARKYFPALKQCKGRLNFVMGDAGKTLEKAADAGFDLMLIDVYTGRSVPEHMVSKETFGLYRAKLKKDGALLVHATGHGRELEEALGKNFAGPGVEVLGKSVYFPLDWGSVHSYWLLAASDPALLKEARGLDWKDIDGA